LYLVSDVADVPNAAAHRVAGQVGPPDCLIRRGPECPVNVVSTAWGQPIVLELGVQPLHVVWRDPFQAVRAESGNQGKKLR
jgi:hypothetical protein